MILPAGKRIVSFQLFPLVSGVNFVFNNDGLTFGVGYQDVHPSVGRWKFCRHFRRGRVKLERKRHYVEKGFQVNIPLPMAALWIQKLGKNGRMSRFIMIYATSMEDVELLSTLSAFLLRDFGFLQNHSRFSQQLAYVSHSTWKLVGCKGMKSCQIQRHLLKDYLLKDYAKE